MVLFKKRRREIRLSNSTIFAYEYAKKILQFVWNNAEHEVSNFVLNFTEAGDQSHVTVHLNAQGQKMGYLTCTLGFRMFKKDQQYHVSADQPITVRGVCDRTVELEILENIFRFTHDETRKLFKGFHMDATELN